MYNMYILDIVCVSCVCEVRGSRERVKERAGEHGCSVRRDTIRNAKTNNLLLKLEILNTHFYTQYNDSH